MIKNCISAPTMILFLVTSICLRIQFLCNTALGNALPGGIPAYCQMGGGEIACKHSPVQVLIWRCKEVYSTITSPSSVLPLNHFGPKFIAPSALIRHGFVSLNYGRLSCRCVYE